jgi:dTDP-glucose 4,6-dehydratase
VIGFMKATIVLRFTRCGRARKPAEVHNIGSWNEKANLDVVRALYAILEKLELKVMGSYRD